MKITTSLAARMLGLSARRVEQLAATGILNFESAESGNNRIIRLFNSEEISTYKLQREAKNKLAKTLDVV